MISGYCGDCDKTIELTESNVFEVIEADDNRYVNIKCPFCEEYEEVRL